MCVQQDNTNNFLRMNKKKLLPVCLFFVSTHQISELRRDKKFFPDIQDFFKQKMFQKKSEENKRENILLSKTVWHSNEQEEQKTDQNKNKFISENCSKFLQEKRSLETFPALQQTLFVLFPAKKGKCLFFLFVSRSVHFFVNFQTPEYPQKRGSPNKVHERGKSFEI